MERLNPILPKNFSSLIEYAFTDRPWWTPGGTGAPGPVQIFNKQVVATESLFKLLDSVAWSQLSFIERGWIMLLVFLAAIQVQKGRVAGENELDASNPIARKLADSLKSLGLTIKGTFAEFSPRGLLLTYNVH